MTDLIDTLRGLCNAGTNDATIGTTAYFSDTHIQTALDRYQTRIIREPLLAIETYAGAGTITYLEYQSGNQNWESGTARFKVEDATGAEIGTSSYTADYVNGVITFTSDQAGSSRILSGYIYDVNAAAADIWRMKAAHVATGVDFATDNMRVNRGNLEDKYLKMAGYYASMANARVMTLGRDDSTIFGEL